MSIYKARKQLPRLQNVFTAPEKKEKEYMQRNEAYTTLLEMNTKQNKTNKQQTNKQKTELEKM